MYAEFLKSKMQADIVIPVPLSNQRLKQRKYNQATKLAQEFCKLSKIPLYENLVLRYQNTHTQTDLSWQQRQENLKNAFKICNKTQQIVNNKKILIVDDVFTTGATTSNLAMLLQSGGAKQVSILTLAHTDFKNK